MRKPILKVPRNGSLQDEESGRYSSDGDVKPILKLRAESPRPRLSFCGAERASRRFNTVCSDFNVQSNAISRDKGDDRDLKKARPLSVLELVKSFETQTNTGAVPKRFGQKRNSDRYRTQPVTSDELEQRYVLTKIGTVPSIRS